MNKRDILIVTILSVLSLAYFFNRGFAYYDEGYILHSAQRIIQGDIPYKDFEFIYTPGTILLVAAFFKLFGESILVGRILVVIVSVLTSILIFKVINKIPRLQKSSLGVRVILFQYLAVLIYLSWFPTHTNFPWPVVFAFPAGLFACFFLFNKKLFIAGTMVFVTFFFKQNFGMATLFACLIYLLILRQTLKNLISFLLGFFIGTLLFIFYLILTHSFRYFINYLSLSSYRIVFQGALGTGFPIGIKSLIYLFPGLVSLVAIVLCWRKNKKLMAFPLFTLFFYLFGIRPTTDYVHLAPLIGMMGIPLVIISIFPPTIKLWRTNKVQSLNIIYGISIILIILGFYTALFKNYYRWDSPLIKQTYYINNPRAKIFVDKKFSQVIPEITLTIQKETKKDEYLFSYFYAPMAYFLPDRKNPTKYESLAVDSLSENLETQLIDELKKKNVRVIFTHQRPEEWNSSLIYQYILKDFNKTKQIFEFSLWERKK